MKKTLLIVSVAVFGLSFGCDGGKGTKDKAAPAVVVPVNPTPTISTFVDSRDGKVYKKVTIGKDVWMAENLNYAAEGSKCYGEGGQIYDKERHKYIFSNVDTQAYCAEYGRLYLWETAIKACPAGFHLPNDYEWKTLENSVGGIQTTGTELKSATGWNNDGNGTDDYGFSALPGGLGYYDSGFSGAGDEGNWWSATFHEVFYAWTRNIGYDLKVASKSGYFNYTTIMFSVRCVQDKIGAADTIDTAALAPDTDTTFTDRRDGKVYRKVEAGGQVWMAENLNYAAEESVCYENKEENCAKYGRLYDWETARIACPAGFHLPSDNEWMTLEVTVGGSRTAGTKLKSIRGWNKYLRRSGNGTDNYGFSALPGGGGGYGDFGSLGYNGLWWSATEYDDYHAWIRYISNRKEYERCIGSRTNQYSVRCVAD